jgi:ubiquinone/menaquinone biosynthesis C-methylase UbiE
MSHSLDRFNWIAKYYDLLSGFVFGKAISRSQLCFLNSIPPRSTILILGGGTGSILKPLLDLNPSCKILYIEASGKMISLAKRRLGRPNFERIRFIHGTESAIPAEMDFDVIITNFFLDIFSEAEVLRVAASLYKKLRTHGFWYVSDFVDEGKWWQKGVLCLMYRFFGETGSIDAMQLPGWQRILKSVGLRAVQDKDFYGAFIKSIVYKKTDSI